MIHKTKVDALEKLDLTRDEALEWIDMLAQKEHKSWDKVVKQHTAIIHKTECIVCYKDKNGEFSYHQYVDTSRLKEIYGIQVLPNWLITLKEESNPDELFYRKMKKEDVVKLDVHRFTNSGWQVLTKDFLEEYEKHYHSFLNSDDVKIFKENGIEILAIHRSFPYWVYDEDRNRYKLQVLSGVKSDSKQGYIRLVQLVCNHFKVL